MWEGGQGCACLDHTSFFGLGVRGGGERLVSLVWVMSLGVYGCDLD